MVVGSNQLNLTQNESDDWPWVFSHDGSKIAFVSRRDNNFEIYIMNIDGSGQINLTNNPANDSWPIFLPMVLKSPSHLTEMVMLKYTL